jgi:Flp pilus assembly protein TadD
MNRSALVRFRRLFPLLLLLAAVVVFHRGARNPFVFDDGMAVVENSTIRDLRDWRAVFSPPDNGSGVSGRPIVNLSLALNHAVGGSEPLGYHLTNILLHGLAGVLFYGCLRHLLPRCGARRATTGAFWAALLWIVHPLQTESVLSVIQRTEILAGIFLLGTILSFLVGSASPRPVRWYTLGFVTCAIGMATKEIMFVTPLLVLLIDRTVVAGTFAEAWRRRRCFHLSLFAGWLVLAALLVRMGGTRGDAAGFGTGEITWWAYFLRQWDAIVTYIRLTAWPDPLIIDYGMDVITDPFQVLPQGLLLTSVALATLEALRRNSPWGLVGAWFFLILGPSSSVMPLPAQTMAEHRMYLPLGALILPVALAIVIRFGRSGPWLAATLVVAMGLTSYARSLDYRSEVSIWTQTVAQRPGNERAHNNLAGALNNRGLHQEAMFHFQRAIALQPRYLAPRIGVANCHFRAGRFAEAIAGYQAALAIDPLAVEALGNLGVLLCEQGRLEPGIELLHRALKISPGFADVHFNLGTVLLKAGRLEEAERHYRDALRLRPRHAEACNNLGAVLLRQGRRSEAEASFRRAVELKPDYQEARSNLQVTLAGGS